MTDESESSPEDESPSEEANAKPNLQSHEVRHQQVSALVPESVARGVFSTGVVVVEGPFEFVIDFLLRMTSPHQLAARVVLPAPVVIRLIAALEENLKNYQKRFGTLPATRSPEFQQQNGIGSEAQFSPDELYSQLKLRDDVLSGTYANAVMIGHSANEFCFDFITTFFPRSAVCCRVYLSALTVPRFLDSLKHALVKHEQKKQKDVEPPKSTPE